MRAFLCLLLAVVPAACQTPPILEGARLERVEAIVSRAMEREKIPGLSVAVAIDGEFRWSRGFGLSDVENNVPATADTMFRLASISKPITAVAVMQLAEQGKLDLDAPIRQYVPSFPAKPWPITARQLLGHLGGIRHYN
ncbi:MAG: beta-lactamase family protein, partial [bacterium]|nr:beta-lactamase family protein [bacterium]